MYSDKVNVNVLTALLVSHGIRDVVVCPGSRNAPLVHNFDVCPDIRCYRATDERSAGFIALGLRQGGVYGVAVCVTSGSAVLNVLPAVAEASYEGLGLVIISADRPRAWIDQLDGQTLPQPGALGGFVGMSVDLPEPHDEVERWYCNRLVNEALIALRSGGCRCVHINVPVTEPLFSFDTPALPRERKVELCRWCELEERGLLAEVLKDARRVMVVVGQLSRRELEESVCVDGRMMTVGEMLAWLKDRFVVLAEQLSMDCLCMTDQLIYGLEHAGDDELRPDCVVYFGGHTVSKRLRGYLRSLDVGVRHVMVSEDERLRDVTMHTELLVTGPMKEVMACMLCGQWDAEDGFRAAWQQFEAVMRQRHVTYSPGYSSMLAVKMFEEDAGDVFDCCCYGNSMSVRLAMIYADHYCYCNRGVNGIEGSLSVAVGMALGLKDKGSKVACVIGDLSFLYDENGLWQQDLSGNLRIILLNNQGGGIFRNLKGLEKSSARDLLVSGNHDIASTEGICQQFGIEYIRATDEVSLKEGMARLKADGGERPVLLEVLTDMAEDERVFKGYYAKLTADS